MIFPGKFPKIQATIRSATGVATTLARRVATIKNYIFTILNDSGAAGQERRDADQWLATTDTLGTDSVKLL